MDLTGLGSIFDFGSKVLDKIFPDPIKANEAKLELFKLQQTGELAKLAAETDLAKGQIAINVEEAKSASLWVSGWRPAFGWTGAAGFAYAVLLDPIARFIAQVCFGYIGPFPAIDTMLTFQLSMGLLGLGAMRTYEKKNGVA